MELSVSRDAFLGALNAASMAATRSTMPILGCVRIEASEGGRLRFLCSDCDRWVETEVSGATVVDPGVACISVERTKALVASWAPGCAVTLRSDERNVHLSASRSRLSFAAEDPATFPKISFEDGERFSIAAADVGKIAALLPSIEPAPARAFLGGVHLVSDGETASACGGASVRLGIVSFPLKGGALGRIILPKDSAHTLVRLARGEEKIEFSVSNDRMRFFGSNWTFTAKLLDYESPNLLAMAGERTETPITVISGDLQAVARRAAAVLNADSFKKTDARAVRLFREPNGGLIVQGNGEVFEDWVDAQVAEETPSVILNAAHLADAADFLGEGEIEIHVPGELKGVRLCRRGEPVECITLAPFRG